MSCVEFHQAEKNIIKELSLERLVELQDAEISNHIIMQNYKNIVNKMLTARPAVKLNSQESTSILALCCSFTRQYNDGRHNRLLQAIICEGIKEKLALSGEALTVWGA